MYDVFQYMLVVVVVGFDKNSFGQDNVDKIVETAAKYVVSIEQFSLSLKRQSEASFTVKHFISCPKHR